MKTRPDQTDAIAIIAGILIIGIVVLLALHTPVPSYLSMIAIMAVGALAGTSIPTGTATSTPTGPAAAIVSDVEHAATAIADTLDPGATARTASRTEPVTAPMDAGQPLPTPTTP